MASIRAASSRVTISPGFRILGSPKLPDFARILPSESTFQSAQKSSFLKCNKAEATKVLAVIWRTTRDSSLSEQNRTAAVRKICKDHDFPPSDLTSLALLLQSSPLSASTSSNISAINLIPDLLSLAESLNDPPAVIRAAKSKISTARSLLILESTGIWRKLYMLASEEKVSEAWDLMAETYERMGERKKANGAWVRGAESGSGKAYLRLGEQAVARGKTGTAIEYLTKAAELGEAEANYKLGLLLAESDKEESEHNLLIAASSGVGESATSLRNHYKSQGNEVMSKEWEDIALEIGKLGGPQGSP